MAPHGSWPPGNGEMARRIREYDWAATSLGPITGWPPSLRTALDMMLAMPAPATILWRILVVEDEFFLADDLRQELEDAGSLVLGPVATVEDALAIIEAEAIDIAVLDINLGGMMSFPVADALLARSVPFLFATGYNKEEVPARYAAVPRCHKPIEPSDIVKAVARGMAAL